MDEIPHPPQEALAVETYVEKVRGQWQVSIMVAFADHVVRHAVNTYHTERVAQIAASWIKRGADRDPAWMRGITGEQEEADD